MNVEAYILGAEQITIEKQGIKWRVNMVTLLEAEELAMLFSEVSEKGSVEFTTKNA